MPNIDTKMPKIRIGITERGDAATDLSWVNKLPTVEGAVIITKNPTHPKVLEALLQNKHKCILHATITGWGRSVLEPNVPFSNDSLNAVKKLVEDGFPIDHVVIRVDPIMPWQTAPSASVIATARQMGFKRIRVSVLDTYRHMTERFHAAGVATPADLKISHEQGIENVNRMLQRLLSQYPDICFEACAEPGLNIEHRGCISDKDLDILQISHDVVDQAGFQRGHCMCYSGKTELLTQKKRCPHQCLYCYWRD